MFGPSRAAVAMGMITTGWSAGYLMGAPIAGYLLEAGGGEKDGTIKPYLPAIFYSGGVAFLAFVLAFVARLSIEKKLNKKV